ncbi:MAG: 4Fe-4S binding protein [Planctomycetes bacterium]|nr:4Fe-4S binding protein [Planctomycetota bacterium]
MPVSCTSNPGPAAKAARLEPRPSRVGRWRALVLVLVHVAIALHVWHWYATGSTLSPLEPSESMAFSQRGIVNAGLIFFALAILSTLVFGRWFCGWACHLVAVQDGARWLLARFGIHPRPLRLGLLASVPWIAFVYMFLSPPVLRALEGSGLAPAGTHLMTEQFWKTFPPWPIAVLSVLVCGGAIVWLLGAKGFCTYGCPYGAIFGIADQFAPLRIRVDENCEHCGHCTTACSSNVNVSQEVREWGTVVDPGCMKCGDCVSVCPKEALHVAWGAPALLTRAREPAPRARRNGLARALLLLAFMFGAYTLLHAYDGRYGAYMLELDATLWKLIAVLASASFAIALLLRGKSRHVQEASFAEECVLGASFLAALFAFRGLRGSTPLLLSFAIAAMLSYLALSSWRLLRRADLSWKNLRLKRAGRLTRAGVLFALAALLAAAGTAAAGLEQRRSTLEWNGRRLEALRAYDQGVARANAQDPAGAVPLFQRALELDPQFLAALENLAGMLCATGRFRDGLELYDRALEIDAHDPATHVLAAQAALGLNDAALARRHLEQALALRPGMPEAQSLLQALDRH